MAESWARSKYLSPDILGGGGCPTGKLLTLYIHVTVHRNRFLFNNQPDALTMRILLSHKTLHVSGIFSAHHQEFSTVHSALVSVMQVYDDRFQAESGCSILTLLGSGHHKLA